ncbi:LysR family transcriptional regulator [Tetragenococcus halophilus]|uniref:LysR family transcriptional regulator n=2 Tax=Tetragenococcus halophilus TaxID=51669 RepID=UPI00265721EA|nr:LysR family transcriptional regulator [Tetragenococcus koreensis]MDN6166606.1 LysR family transcriptional regulator [Tetragenococcus koreensis]MDN6267989.1 LysR family transcriptional regulator [Tetragenococcus koreensis]MDN6391626.1 LysR family transcriptional regulator [Lactococcus lactis]MDN6630731.1 LysR family transcriptional regulator [Staphylococcus equorum]
MLNRKIEIFIKIVEYGNITKAAKALYTSQPAISNALSNLESELNVKLFFRDKKNGILLTEVGQKIFKLAKQMENTNNRIYQTAYKENNLFEGNLRIASLPSLTSTLFSKAFKKFRELYPKVNIDLKEGSPNEVFKMVNERTVDFGLSSSPFKQLDSMTLIHDHIIAVSSKGHIEKNIIDLSIPPDTLVINKPAYETIMDKIPAKKSLNNDQILLVQNAETAIEMVNDDIGIGIISNYTIDTLGKSFFKYPIDPKISLEVGLFSNDLNDLTPIASEFVRLIKEENPYILTT